MSDPTEKASEAADTLTNQVEETKENEELYGFDDNSNEQFNLPQEKTTQSETVESSGSADNAESEQTASTSESPEVAADEKQDAQEESAEQQEGAEQQEEAAEQAEEAAEQAEEAAEQAEEAAEQAEEPKELKEEQPEQEESKEQPEQELKEPKEQPQEITEPKELKEQPEQELEQLSEHKVSDQGKSSFLDNVLANLKTAKEAGENPDSGEPQEEEDEDDYDPLDGVEESPGTVPTPAPSATTTVPTTTPSAATTVPTTTPSAATPSSVAPAPAGAPDNAALSASISKIMSSNLLSDPEFLKLSDSEKQQRILEEITKSSAAATTGPAAAPPQEHKLGTRVDLTQPLSPEEIRKHSKYLEAEAEYSSSRHPFIPGSRLFAGNLPKDFSKLNIWRLFQVYGEIIDISMKASYAFIQYTDAKSVNLAIQYESDAPLGGKDLILEVAKGPKQNQNQNQNDRLYGSKQPSYFGNSSSLKRSRNEEAGSSKRRNVRECHVFVKRTADPEYARELVRVFQNAGISTEYTFLKPGMDLTSLINDVAYQGAIGVVLVNKNRNCDVQIYEKTPDGGIKFDEYLSVNSSDATQLLLRAKSNSSGSMGYGAGSFAGYGSSSASPLQNMVPNMNQFGTQQFNQNALLQSLQSMPPAAVQQLLSMTQQQQLPQFQAPMQQGYQQYQQPMQPQQPQFDLNSLLSKLQPPPQQNSSANGYYPPNSGYNPQQTAPQQQQQQGTNVQSLLDSLAKLQK